MRSSVLWMTIALAFVSIQTLAQHSDEASDKLLADYVAAIGKLKSVRADVAIDASAEGIGPTRKVSGYLIVKRPNLVRVHLPCAIQKRSEEFVCDGKLGIIYSTDSPTYMAGAPSAFVAKLNGPETFFLSDKAVKAVMNRLGAPHLVGQPVPIDGKLCQKLEFVRDGDYVRLYIGPDKLPRGIDSKTEGLTSSERYTNFKANAAIPETTFKWRPPSSAKRERISD